MTNDPWVMAKNGRLIYNVQGDRLEELIHTPGSWWARKAGCTCGVLDNDFGRGIPKPLISEGSYSRIEFEYTITPNCPLHDRRNPYEVASPEV